MQERTLSLFLSEPEAIVSTYFKDKDGRPLELAHFQRDFVKAILSRDHLRVIFLAARQSGKCFGRGTKILMFDGSIKEAQDIKVNDLVMGDDSMPRCVLSTHSGLGSLYSVESQGSYADSYVVNGQHTLCLAHKYRGKKIKYEEIEVERFQRMSNYSKIGSHFGYQKPVFFSDKTVFIEPYWLGLWLGDGRVDSTQITSVDFEVIDYLREYSERLGMKLSIYKKKGKEMDYALTGKYWHSNALLEELKNLEVWRNKHIPRDYLMNSEKKRLELLAGLIDTDGHKPKQKEKKNTCEIVFANKRLAEDVVFLARSLGFRTSIHEKKTSIKSTGFIGSAFRIMLYGELWRIPTRIERKKYKKTVLYNIPANHGIRIEPAGFGEYFGFETDGNKRFLLSDFTVAHNSEAIACAIALLALSYSNERIINISYTDDQARIIFERVKAHLVEDSEYVRSLVDLNRSLGKAKEFSRKRMFMKNGTEIRIMSTGKGETESVGESLLGFEGTIVVVDEAGSISDEIFRTKILPMISAKRSSEFEKMLILSGTPHRPNHFKKSWNNPDFLKFKVDWKMAVDAGRLSEKTVMDARKLMTSTEFEAWYCAEFPSMTEDSVFDMKEIERNVVSQQPGFNGIKILSVDVARFGGDFTVYTQLDYCDDIYRVVEIIKDEHKDLMNVAGRIMHLNGLYNFNRIIVDESGIGGGVLDRLKEQGLDKAAGIIAGSSCTTDELKENCLNLKAELYMKAKKLFEENRLKIIGRSELIEELELMRKDFQSTGKIKIIDPEKSPDFADSLVYGLFAPDEGGFVIFDRSSPPKDEGPRWH